MKIFFSVGEPSGDLHGANLIRELRARGGEWEFVGYGGPRMAAAGADLHADLTKLAVMWLLRVLWNLRTFLRLKRDAERYFRDSRPDAVVLIDYPGFNWHIARVAKRRGIPVVYYGTPQLWGWAPWRVKKLRRDVDHALCKLPFEEAWLRERGCNATHVGHPYFDELHARKIDQAFVDQLQSRPGPLVTILPGSRTQEVKANLAQQLATAKRVRDAVPDARFAVAAYKRSQLDAINVAVAASGVRAEVHVDRTPELIAAAACCLSVSGSVSLELLHHGKPTVIVYAVSWFGDFLQGVFRRVRYITLVNLLTTDDLFPHPVGGYDPSDPRDAHALMPEYLTRGDQSERLAAHLVEWLTNDAARRRNVAGLERLRAEVGRPGASRRAAEYLVDRLPATRDARRSAA